MLLQEESVKEISRELSQIYRKQYEAENIVKKYGPVLAIKEIFYQDEEIS
jgi:hypothetical protein